MLNESLKEKILGAKWKIRILSLLAKLNVVTITYLVKNTGSFYKNVVKYIELLKEYEIVNEKKFGKTRLIVANEKSDLFLQISNLLQRIDLYEKRNKN